jgi:hypothetical protein
MLSQPGLLMPATTLETSLHSLSSKPEMLISTSKLAILRPSGLPLALSLVPMETSRTLTSNSSVLPPSPPPPASLLPPSSSERDLS